MSCNSFGQIFKWTTFGESHGPSIGLVLEGCPAGVPWNSEWLQKDLDRRRPGQASPSGEVLVTSRDEADRCEMLSGVFEGKTLGTPIACRIENTNQRSQDYSKMTPRPGHADESWKTKYVNTDLRGGGRSSGRETASRVIAGSIARMMLQELQPELKVAAFARRIGEHELDSTELTDLSTKLGAISQNDIHKMVDKSPARFPTKRVDIADYLLKAKASGESYGGVGEVWIENCRPGLGEPVFYKMKSVLANAMMSIGATCGFEIGEGFALTQKKGTEVHAEGRKEPYGGIQGGITTGDRIVFRVGFKPTSSILDIAKAGRHDPCIVPRAVPVVEAMTWAILADMSLLQRLNNV